MSKNKSMLGHTVDQTTITHDSHKNSTEPLKLDFPQRIGIFVGNKHIEYFIAFLVVAYCCIVTIRISFENDLTSSNPQLNVLEILILSIFLLEVILKAIVIGKEYFNSLVRVLDLLVILACIIILLLNLDEKNTNYAKESLARLFRIFRLLFMFKKAASLRLTTSKRVNKKYSVVSVTTPSDNVVKTLVNFLNFEWVALNDSLKEEIVWCIEVIKSRKMYEVNIIADTLENNEIAKMGLNEVEYGESHEDYTAISTNLALHTLDPNLASGLLKNCMTWEFDLFKLEKETMNCGLEVLIDHFFSAYNLFASLDISQIVFNSFIHEISQGYISQNPYHNSSHAADVVQAFYYIISTCEARIICSLNDSDIAICLISAAIHDFQHPGYNNMYMINSSDPLAIRYNDKSVLENHHLAASFAILQQEYKDIFKNFPKDIYKKIRLKIINLVFATDFSRHFADISRFQTKMNEGVVGDEESKNICMEMMMHACDISNPTRPWEFCAIWAERVTTEFFLQGDKERELGLPISQLCDRLTVSIPKSQVGFMEMFIEPTFTALLLVIPKVEVNLRILKQNKKNWLDKKDS